MELAVGGRKDGAVVAEAGGRPFVLVGSRGARVEGLPEGRVGDVELFGRYAHDWTLGEVSLELYLAQIVGIDWGEMG